MALSRPKLPCRLNLAALDARDLSFASSAEVARGLPCHLQELLPRGEVLLELPHLALVTGGARLVEVGLDVGDGAFELAEHVVGAGGLLRVAALPLVVLHRADGLLDLPDAP